MKTFKLDNEAVTKLLTSLQSHPSMFSFIEQDYADELEARNLFSLETFSVTESGAQFLKEHA